MKDGVTMTFNELIEYYNFRKKGDGKFFKQVANSTWCVIEIHEVTIETEETDNGRKMELIYDFYKVSRYRNGYVEYKEFEKGINEIFLVSRVKKYFKYLKKLEHQKKLKPYGGSEYGYLKHLKEQRVLEKKKNEEFLKYWEMTANNLEIHDRKESRRKQAPNQMKMKI